MATHLPDVSTSSTLLGPSRRQSFCGSHDPSAAPLCLLAAGPGCHGNRCIFPGLGAVSPPTRPSTLEPDRPRPSQATTRSSTTRNSGRTTLAWQPLVSHSPRNISGATNHSGSLVHHPAMHSNHPLAVPESNVKAICLAGLQRRFDESTGLNEDATALLTAHLTDDTPTNRTYKCSQELFCRFAIDQNIDIHNFSHSDLINFLSSAHHSGYSLNTIKLYKTAALKFHHFPAQFLKDVDIMALLKKFANDAPPIPLGRAAIDLSPTFHHLIALHPQAVHNLRVANEVAAFLLAAPKNDDKAALLSNVPQSRSTPIALPCARCMLSRLYRIILELPPCALLTFSSWIAFDLNTQTIPKWLCNLVQLSTDTHPAPSVRSLGTNLAIARGIPVADVVTLGNWSSDAVMDTHYRRQRLTQTDVTSAILRPPVSID
ncbi:hypothetical protein BJV82DRAFT_679807 [Fennellomyces sp. T-0311]|nr:hypothetical protein BJV82DRAFT_679807 [Fennellomyces sp. T-0311]